MRKFGLQLGLLSGGGSGVLALSCGFGWFRIGLVLAGGILFDMVLVIASL
jgi:hypothetical protein